MVLLHVPVRLVRDVVHNRVDHVAHYPRQSKEDSQDEERDQGVRHFLSSFSFLLFSVLFIWLRLGEGDGDG